MTLAGCFLWSGQAISMSETEGTQCTGLAGAGGTVDLGSQGRLDHFYISRTNDRKEGKPSCKEQHSTV